MEFKDYCAAMGIFEQIDREDGLQPRTRRRPRLSVSDSALDYSCGHVEYNDDRPTRNKIRRLNGPKYIPLADYLNKHKNEVITEQDESAIINSYKNPSDLSVSKMEFEQQYPKIPAHLKRRYENVHELYKLNFKKDRRVWLHKSSLKIPSKKLERTNDVMQNEPQLAKKDSRIWLHKSSEKKNKSIIINETNNFHPHEKSQYHNTCRNKVVHVAPNESPTKNATLISSSASLYLNTSFENLYVDTDTEINSSQSNDSITCLPDLDNDWCIL